MDIPTEPYVAEHTTQRFPLEALQNMELPKVPDNLSKFLSITWNGRGGIPAKSAVGALTDKQGNPLATISFYFKRYIHEETIPFKDAEREMSIYIEVAQEALL